MDNSEFESKISAIEKAVKQQDQYGGQLRNAISAPPQWSVGTLGQAYEQATNSIYAPTISPRTYQLNLTLPDTFNSEDESQYGRTTDHVPRHFEVPLDNPQMASDALADIMLKYASKHMSKAKLKELNDFFLSKNL